MNDRRRSQWIAFDAMFFSSTMSDDLLERFGPAGWALWWAYLAGCKRSLVPGQITYISDDDCIAQLGLVGVNLVNQEGQEWTLDQFWRRLGELHATARRGRNDPRTSSGRGRNGTTTIVCRAWNEWQKDAQRARHAEQQASSRAGNASTKAADMRSETDIETDSDRETRRDENPNGTDLAVVHDLPLLPTGFDAFWQHWPEQARQMRDDARRAWTAARGAGASEVAILVGVDAWSAHWTTAGTDPQYIPHPANWIKKKRWLDPPPAAPLSKGDKQNRDIIANAIEFAGGEP